MEPGGKGGLSMVWGATASGIWETKLYNQHNPGLPQDLPFVSCSSLCLLHTQGATEKLYLEQSGVGSAVAGRCSAGPTTSILMECHWWHFSPIFCLQLRSGRREERFKQRIWWPCSKQDCWTQQMGRANTWLIFVMGLLCQECWESPLNIHTRLKIARADSEFLCRNVLNCTLSWGSSGILFLGLQASTTLY